MKVTEVHRYVNPTSWWIATECPDGVKQNIHVSCEDPTYLVGEEIFVSGDLLIHNGRVICIKGVHLPRPEFELVSGTIERATAASVGFDLFYAGDVPFILKSLVTRRIPTGVKTRFSPWLQAIIKDKSGIAGIGIETLAGVIEGDYPDEWEVVLVNLNSTVKTVMPGSKVAQVILVEKPSVKYIGEGILFKNCARVGGFGSTGKVSISGG